MKKTILVCMLAVCGCVYAEGKKDVAAAIARGVAFLRTQQEADGHFSDPHMPAL